jgi:hypothetical protein
MPFVNQNGGLYGRTTGLGDRTFMVGDGEKASRWIRACA